MRLLIVRPQPDAARTEAAVRARGHEPIVAPLIAIEIVPDVDLGAGPWAAFLATSANAVAALAGRIRDDVRNVPVFTVGARTAQAFRDLGFNAVISADGNVNDLADLVATRLKPPARLLYLAGEDRSGDLAGDLRARNFAVETVVVYRAVPATSLPREVTEALTRNVGGVLHFSRRGAQAYINAARNAGILASALKPVHFCLSARVAEPLADAGAAKIRVASKPTEAALLELVDLGAD